MLSSLLLCAFVAVSVSAAASSAVDDDRGPLACSTDFCPIYCGNVQPITPMPSDADTQVPPTQPHRTLPCASSRHLRSSHSPPQLLHVAAAMRHGARTPAFGKTCFYSLPIEQQQWDCALDLCVPVPAAVALHCMPLAVCHPVSCFFRIR
jgi:hypothetical protein